MAQGAELPQTTEQDRYPMSVTGAGAAGIQEGRSTTQAALNAPAPGSTSPTQTMTVTPRRHTGRRALASHGRGGFEAIPVPVGGQRNR